MQRADQRPNLQTQGNATRQRTPAYLNATSASQVQAVVGLAAFEVDLSERFTGGQRSWSFTPQISLPSFDAGRNSANLDLATLFKVLSEGWPPPRDGAHNGPSGGAAGTRRLPPHTQRPLERFFLCIACSAGG